VCLAPDPLNPLNDVSTMNKIMEYMAMSRPIVSFDLREARVSAGDAVVYAPANDELEFAKLIARLLDDPDERSRMGTIGQSRISGPLSWQNSRKSLHCRICGRPLMIVFLVERAQCPALRAVGVLRFRRSANRASSAASLRSAFTCTPTPSACALAVSYCRQD
jgi:hypothetical protein